MTVASSETLPRVVRFLDTVDAPDSQCPHCGATGRYILRFQVADGRTLGAMRGCAKLFPASRIATEELRLRNKLGDYAKRGWSLNAADAKALQAIDAFYAGTLDEASALREVDYAKSSNSARRRARYGR